MRVQHRSGILWVCNSAGLAALDAEQANRRQGSNVTGRGGSPAGCGEWINGWRSGSARPSAAIPLDLSELSQEAAALGVTGWTEATPERSDRDTGVLLEGVASGAVRQRLHLMLPTARAADTAGAVAEVGARGLTAGPVKILLDDPDLPALDAFTATITRIHREQRPVAVHCVTRVQLLLTLAALEVAGPRGGDRIEHGAAIPVETLPTIARLGLMVVTQPNFVAERGDEYLTDVAADELPDLWRGRSLVDAGIPVAAGTDAPFGGPDPWLAIRAAIRRRTPSGRVLGPAEAVTTGVALHGGGVPARRRRSGAACAPAIPRTW